jgi:putative hydrolase of the HAD superfamily
MFGTIKHIFFDLDDTLWDFEKNSAAVMVKLYAEHDLEKKLNAPFEDFKKAYIKLNKEFWKKYNHGIIDKQHLRNHRFNETFKLFNYDNYEENLIITDKYLKQAPYGKHLVNGCHEVLEHLQKKYPLHIITNGFSEIQDIKLDGSGLRKYFSQIIISETHGINKPNEGIFRIAENLAGASKEECLMIGDSFESDIEGAENAGWKSIHFSMEAVNTSTNRIERLHQLIDLL